MCSLQRWRRALMHLSHSQRSFCYVPLPLLCLLLMFLLSPPGKRLGAESDGKYQCGCYAAEDHGSNVHFVRDCVIVPRNLAIRVCCVVTGRDIRVLDSVVSVFEATSYHDGWQRRHQPSPSKCCQQCEKDCSRHDCNRTWGWMLHMMRKQSRNSIKIYRACLTLW